MADCRPDGRTVSEKQIDHFKTYKECVRGWRTESDNKKYQVAYYNLDMIISVGYRVKSHRGV